MITVFYDGKCGLCRREIQHYQRIAPRDRFLWRDITVDPASIESIGIRYADGLKLLHAHDIQGTLYVGVDAFLLIWREIPRWCVLASVIALPGIHTLANLAYNLFASWRFKRLTHCQLAAAPNETQS